MSNPTPTPTPHDKLDCNHTYSDGTLAPEKCCLKHPRCPEKLCYFCVDKHHDHICRFNDGDCVCNCYAEGFAKGSHDERLNIEKLKLEWSDIGYRNGVEAAKEILNKEETLVDVLSALDELLTNKS